MPGTDEWETRRLWYRGRFLSTKMTLVHNWLGADTGGVYSFKKAPLYPIIGGLYEVEFSGNAARIQSAKHLDDNGALHPDYQQWRLDDQAAAVAKQHYDALKRMSSHNTDISDMTLNQIRKLMGNQPRHVRNGTLLIVMDYLR